MEAGYTWTERAGQILLREFTEPTPRTMRAARLFHWIETRMRRRLNLAPRPNGLAEWAADVKAEPAPVCPNCGQWQSPQGGCQWTSSPAADLPPVLDCVNECARRGLVAR